MDLDRGALAKINRRLFSGLSHGEQYHMIRAPVSPAAWSAWKRYCGTLGISMGRAIVTLIENELGTVVGNSVAEPVLPTGLENHLGKRQATLDERERQLDAREQRLAAQEGRIAALPVRPRPRTHAAKIGRNDPCPCESGLKYKRCHGM